MIFRSTWEILKTGNVTIIIIIMYKTFIIIILSFSSKIYYFKFINFFYIF